MSETVYIYTIDDLDTFGNDIFASGGLALTSVNVAPDYLRINDNDTILDAFTAGDPDQVLASDLTIGGVTVGHAGDAVSIGTDSSVTNFGAGAPGGTFSTIIVGGNVVGFVSTFELVPGLVLAIDSPIPGTGVDYAGLAACFTRGTKIMCPEGAVPVQALKAGDEVITLQSGPQKIRWVGSHEANGAGALAPVRFKAGAIGNSLDILVSPMHRMHIAGPRAEMLFGLPEALAHAKDLCDGDRIFREPTPKVRYYHILFDDHQILSAHGCWSESFAPHRDAVDAFEQKCRDEILALFPQLDANWKDALPTLTAAEATLAMGA